MRFAHVLTRLTGAPWFITEDALLRITDLLESRLAAGAFASVPSLSSVPLLPSQEDSPEGADDLPAATPGLGVVEINGVLGTHLSLMERICGGVDYSEIVSQARGYAQDPSISKIVFHTMVCPGGTATGCPEAYAALQQIKADSGKPFLSVITGQCCSAGYYLAAACDTIVATESSMVGSIGTMRLVEDRSAANAAAGIKRFAITSASMKDIGNPDRPMTDPEKAHLQAMTNYLGGLFQRDMTAARPQIAAEVFAAGLPYYAADAQRLGLIDAMVPGLNDVLGSLAAASVPA
jgi:protease-4